MRNYNENAIDTGWNNDIRLYFSEDFAISIDKKDYVNDESITEKRCEHCEHLYADYLLRVFNSGENTDSMLLCEDCTKHIHIDTEKQTVTVK